MILQNIRFLVTQNDKREILTDVDVLIRENQIKKIGPRLDTEGEEVIDCQKKIVMPGLINCHTHLGMTMLRGNSDDKELAEWLKEVVSAEKKMDEEEIAAGVYLGIAEAIRTGTTTIVDMYDPILPSILAAQDLGIRMLAVPSFFLAHRTFDKDTIADEIPGSNDSHIRVGVGPHSLYGTTEEFLKASKEYAKQNNLPIHIHLSETRKERAEFRAKQGILPIEYLENIGFLDKNVMLVHSVWLTKKELDIIAKHGAKIVHCPQSNMKLAGGGVMPLREMHERGLVVGLGTDSAVSNNSLDMFREMHTCALLHKHHYWDPQMAPAQTILDMATRDGAKASGHECLGKIEEGMLADIITLDLQDPNLQPMDEQRVISAIVYSANGMNVCDVIIDGKLVLREKKTVRE